MSYGVSTRLKGKLPKRYVAQWLKTVDKRTKLWCLITARIEALQTDAGGEEHLSHAKRSIIQRAVFLELLCETEEAAFAAGKQLNIGKYTQSFNSMIGAYRMLGIERKAKRGPSLREVMDGKP